MVTLDCSRDLELQKGNPANLALWEATPVAEQNHMEQNGDRSRLLQVNFWLEFPATRSFYVQYFLEVSMFKIMCAKWRLLAGSMSSGTFCPLVK